MDVDSVEVCDTGDEDLDNTPRAPRGRNLGDAWIQYKARLLGHLSLSGLSPEEVRNIKDASAKSKKDQQLLLHLIEAFGVSFVRRKNPDMATNMSGLQAWDKLIDEMERKNCANALRVLNNFGSMLLPGSLDAALRSPETGTLWCQDLQKVAEHARLQELNPLTIMCTIAMGKLYQTCGLDVASVLPVDDREAFGPKDLENHVKKLSARYKEGSRSSSLMYEEDADGVATLEQDTIQEHTPISKQETKSKQETDSKQETTSEKETGTEAKAVSEKKATSEEKATLEEKATSEEKTIPPACSQCGGEHHAEKCTGRGDTVWCEFCKQGTHSSEACTRQESLLVSPSPQQTKASSNDAKTQETDTGEVAKRTESPIQSVKPAVEPPVETSISCRKCGGVHSGSKCTRKDLYCNFCETSTHNTILCRSKGRRKKSESRASRQQTTPSEERRSLKRQRIGNAQGSLTPKATNKKPCSKCGSTLHVTRACRQKNLFCIHCQLNSHNTDICYSRGRSKKNGAGHKTRENVVHSQDNDSWHQDGFVDDRDGSAKDEGVDRDRSPRAGAASAHDAAGPSSLYSSLPTRRSEKATSPTSGKASSSQRIERSPRGSSNVSTDSPKRGSDSAPRGRRRSLLRNDLERDFTETGLWCTFCRRATHNTEECRSKFRGRRSRTPDSARPLKRHKS